MVLDKIVWFYSVYSTCYVQLYALYLYHLHRSNMSGTDTPEYKTFFRNQADIAETIGDINGLIDSIVANLYAKKIVGKAVRDAADIHAPDVTEVKRVRPVLKAILKKIELNKDVYYKVRDVMLSSEPGLEQLLPKSMVCENHVCAWLITPLARKEKECVSLFV